MQVPGASPCTWPSYAYSLPASCDDKMKPPIAVDMCIMLWLLAKCCNLRQATIHACHKSEQ